MSNQAFELAILISLKDAASSGADRVGDRLRSMGKEGKVALKTFEDLRKDLRKGLVIAGIGAAGLAAINKGVNAAGDFEASMTDLRLAFAETGKDGQINMAALGDSLNRLESLSVRLGNKLPGNTKMFVEMLAQLKQGGLETETILNGAGEAVANLSVVTNQLPKDLAKDFSQFGMQFKLKPDEYVKAADLFARIKSRTDLGSSELIEGSKYFQLRAGAPLGLKGLQGAETGAMLMAAMKRVGLEGSVAGTGTSNFFKEIADPKKLKAVKKDFGVDLQFFDKKGNFLGVDNAFKEMQKLRKLSTQKRMMGLDKLAGSEGAAVGNAMTEMGLQGWKDISSEINSAVSLQEAINQKTADYAAKIEAISGTLDNLKVTAFTPLLDTLKPVVDTLNTGVGSVQEFLKAHQTTASVAAHMLGVGSATLFTVGTVKHLTAAWKLWKLASSLNDEQKLLTFLRKLGTESDKTAKDVERSAGRSTKAADKMGRSFGTMFMRGVGAGVIGVELSNIIVQKFRDDLEKAEDGLKDAQAGGYESYKKLPDNLKPQYAPGQAQSALAAINRNDMLKRALSGGGGFDALSSITRNIPLVGFTLTDQKYDRFGSSFDVSKAGEEFRKFAPGLQEADIMKHAIKRVQGGAMGLDPTQRPSALKALEAAWPESFRKANEMIQAEGKTHLVEMAALASKFDGPTNQSVDALNKLTKAGGDAATSSDSVARQLARAAVAASMLADNVGIPKDNGGKPKVKVKRARLPIPGLATGGFVEQEGLVHIHSGERVISAARVRRDSQTGSAKNVESGTITVHGGIHIHPPKGSAMAENPEAFGRAVMNHVTNTVRRQRERR